MKAVHYKNWLLILGLFMFTTMFSQEDKFDYITVTKMHFNLNNPDLKFEDWQKLEKEYFDKVTSKNDLVIRHNCLTHYFTDDNTEVLNVNVYKSWEDIDKAGNKTADLVKNAWPNENERKAFFKKLRSYYADTHSDEIYASMPYTKPLNAKSDESFIYYVRNSHFSSSDEGSSDEFDSLMKEFFENVTMKNDLIKGYYTLAHAWGSDKTDFLEVFVVEKLGDIDEFFKKEGELFEKHWRTEKEREEFDKKMNKYFSRHHSDYIYRSVKGLRK